MVANDVDLELESWVMRLRRRQTYVLAQAIQLESSERLVGKIALRKECGEVRELHGFLFVLTRTQNNVARRSSTQGGNEFRPISIAVDFVRHLQREREDKPGGRCAPTEKL